MIPKQDKECSKAENYRFISLTNCLAKVCETVVKNIVLEHCESLKMSLAKLRAHRGNIAVPQTTLSNSLSTLVKIFSGPKWLV